MFSDLKDEAREQLAQTLQKSPDPLVRAQARGVIATARQYLGLLVRREHYRAAYRAFFRDWDVLLAPVTITCAFPHVSSNVPFEARALQVNGEAVPYTRLQVYPRVATLGVSRIAECRVGLRQISFGLLPPAGPAGATRSLGIRLRPLLWLPDERRGRLTEAVNPSNEVIDVRRVGTRPMAPPLLHDSQ